MAPPVGAIPTTVFSGKSTKPVLERYVKFSTASVPSTYISTAGDGELCTICTCAVWATSAKVLIKNTIIFIIYSLYC